MKAVEPAGKDAPAAGNGRQRRLLLGLLGLGLLLAGAAIALAIALPLTLRSKSSGASTTSPVELQSADEPSGVLRKYYISAEPIDWDYVPSKKNLCKNGPFTEEQAIHVSAGIGSKYKKGVYREYADETFAVSIAAAHVTIRSFMAFNEYTFHLLQRPVERTAEQLHMGLLGKC
jgi:hypothetical protein